MEKRVDCGILLSFYGALLTERQRELLSYRYEEDLSLSEIAALCGMTRQGAHDAIRRGERQLEQLEAQLMLRGRWECVCAGLRACRPLIEAGDAEGALKIIDDLLLREEEQDGV